MIGARINLASPDPQNPTKITNLPLLKNNNNANGVSNSNSNKIPRSRSVSVSSRYMSSSSSPSPSTSASNSSSSSSRRYPSPLVSRNSPSTNDSPNLALKRSASVGRRRQPPPDPGKVTDVSAAAKLLVTSSRSLSVSFQGEAFPLAVGKSKVAPNSLRKGRIPGHTGIDQVENFKPSDHHRWPGRNPMALNSNALSGSLSLDCGSIGMAKGKANGISIRALQPSVIDDRRNPDGNVVNNEASDTDSVSSTSTTGVQECKGTQNGANGIVVSARFWQETNRRLRRLQDPGSPLVTAPSSKLTPPPKSRRFADSPLSPSPRMARCPIRGGIRAASPGKAMTPVGSSPSRGQSPSRIRNGSSVVTANSFCETPTPTPSVLSYAVDAQRRKVGENKMIDAHLLRLVHNRHLQWRFVNARSEATSLVQKRKAEKNLWNVWITISDLRDCLTKKRHRVQLLRQKLKLASILKGQITFLEDWASLDENHSLSLVGAIESLKASTLRLPVVGGAIANVQSLQDAIGSAVDIMQAMSSSLCFLLPLVSEANILASELAKTSRKERDMVQQCTDFISRLAAMQVKISSLRTHVLQHNRTKTPPRHDLSG